jgi:hypothetical protein
MATLAAEIETYVKELLETNHNFRLKAGEARMRSLTQSEAANLSNQGFGGDDFGLIETMTQRVDEEMQSFVVNIMKNTLADFRPDDITNDVFCRNHKRLSAEVEG